MYADVANASSVQREVIQYALSLLECEKVVRITDIDRTSRGPVLGM